MSTGLPAQPSRTGLDMNYGSHAQTDMPAMLDEGKTVPEAALAWVDARASMFRRWLP